MKVILIIDEASLFRLGVFTELHTLTQFEGDSKPFLPLILAGQSNLIDNLTFPNSMPLAPGYLGGVILARGSIVVAARKKSAMVTAEHVRIAATEIF